MWNPFRSKPLLSNDDQSFQIECYRWLLTHFGGDDFYKTTRLILPTRDFFPLTGDSPQTTAEICFEQVKQYAGLQDWPCRLEMQAEDPETQIAPTIAIKDGPRSPLGTFSADQQNEITITYHPNIVNDPTQMVATFAHELAHYLTATAPEHPPGGWENWEFATDIAVSFLGFGIFSANSAFRYRQFADYELQGWSMSKNGYLSEPEYAYALALFLLLKKNPVDKAASHCTADIKYFLKRAVKEIKKTKIVKELRRV